MSKIRPAASVADRVLLHMSGDRATTVLLRYSGGASARTSHGFDFVVTVAAKVFAAGGSTNSFRVNNDLLHAPHVWDAVRGAAAENTQTVIVLVDNIGMEAPFVGEHDYRLVLNGNMSLRASLERILDIPNIIIIFTADRDADISAYAMKKMDFVLTKTTPHGVDDIAMESFEQDKEEGYQELRKTDKNELARDGRNTAMKATASRATKATVVETATAQGVAHQVVTGTRSSRRKIVRPALARARGTFAAAWTKLSRGG